MGGCQTCVRPYQAQPQLNDGKAVRTTQQDKQKDQQGKLKNGFQYSFVNKDPPQNSMKIIQPASHGLDSDTAKLLAQTKNKNQKKQIHPANPFGREATKNKLQIKPNPLQNSSPSWIDHSQRPTKQLQLTSNTIALQKDPLNQALLMQSKNVTLFSVSNSQPYTIENSHRPSHQHQVLEKTAHTVSKPKQEARDVSKEQLGINHIKISQNQPSWIQKSQRPTKQLRLTSNTHEYEKVSPPKEPLMLSQPFHVGNSQRPSHQQSLDRTAHTATVPKLEAKDIYKEQKGTKQIKIPQNQSSWVQKSQRQPITTIQKQEFNVFSSSPQTPSQFFQQKSSHLPQNTQIHPQRNNLNQTIIQIQHHIPPSPSSKIMETQAAGNLGQQAQRSLNVRSTLRSQFVIPEQSNNTPLKGIRWVNNIIIC